MHRGCFAGSFRDARRIVVLFIVLRIIEFAGHRSRVKQADRYFDMVGAKIDAQDRGEIEDRLVVLSTGREVILSKFRMPTGKIMWYVNSQGAELTEAEQGEATAMLKELFPKE